MLNRLSHNFRGWKNKDKWKERINGTFGWQYQIVQVS
ncbi:MAG TPA: hypothetical protein GXZ37_08800 [Clostridiales bacterium]|nr:hypothetical protein [Clostridiales bacterium]